MTHLPDAPAGAVALCPHRFEITVQACRACSGSPARCHLSGKEESACGKN